jgi:hypothetical protein
MSLYQSWGVKCQVLRDIFPGGAAGTSELPLAQDYCNDYKAVLAMLRGGDQPLVHAPPDSGEGVRELARSYSTRYEGVIPWLERRHSEAESDRTREQIEGYMREVPCPECGGSLHLMVGSDNTRLGPWLLAAGSLTLALGFDGVVTVLLMTVALIIDPPKSPAAAQMATLMVGSFLTLTAVNGIGILGLVRRRRRWNRMPLRWQWRAAVALFIGVGTGHALFAWLLVTRFT